MRIGIGYDVHGFAEKRKLILGGTEIPYSQGLQGHSDADVLTHAIMDALLGACALGDIGQHFPDSDSMFKDISSMELLHKVMRLISEQGLQIGNIDCIIIAQKPKLAPYIETMRSNLALAMETEVANISVKATTTEGLGFEGRGEGIGAQAAVLLIPVN
jgi:2-C-methyl-D-erythritol 2,4-cyclodiphosphate synthase